MFPEARRALDLGSQSKKESPAIFEGIILHPGVWVPAFGCLEVDTPFGLGFGIWDFHGHLLRSC